MDFGAVFVATCIAAAFGSVVMGLYGNYPIALAPGMAQNAFFTFGVVLGMGHTWQSALGAVFLSGIIFVALSVLPVREWLVNAIPRTMKLGMAAGIGLFLGFIALRTRRSSSPTRPHSSPSETSSRCRYCSRGGFVVIAALAARGVPGAIIIGSCLPPRPAGYGETEFNGVVSMPPSPAPVSLQLDIAAAFEWSMVR